MESKLTPEEKEALKARLTPLQYRVTQEKGTEYAFSNEFHDNKKPGEYYCIVCDVHLFSYGRMSSLKIDAGQTRSTTVVLDGHLSTKSREACRIMSTDPMEWCV